MVVALFLNRNVNYRRTVEILLEVGERDVLGVYSRHNHHVAVEDEQGASSIDGDVFHVLDEYSYLLGLVGLVDGLRVGNVNGTTESVVFPKVVNAFRKINGDRRAVFVCRPCSLHDLTYGSGTVFYSRRIETVVGHVDNYVRVVSSEGR